MAKQVSAQLKETGGMAEAKEQSNNRRARAKAKDQGQAATFAEELIINQSARRKEESKV